MSAPHPQGNFSGYGDSVRGGYNYRDGRLSDFYYPQSDYPPQYPYRDYQRDRSPLRGPGREGWDPYVPVQHRLAPAFFDRGGYDRRDFSTPLPVYYGYDRCENNYGQPSRFHAPPGRYRQQDSGGPSRSNYARKSRGLRSGNAAESRDQPTAEVNMADNGEEVEIEEVEHDTEDGEIEEKPYLEQNRSWLPGASVSDSSSGPETSQAGPSGLQNAVTNVVTEGRFVPKEVIDNLSSWILEPITGEVSKSISKRFSLLPEVKNFSLKPPKLDGFMYRRAKEKGVLRSLNSTEDVLTIIQHKLLDIVPPMVDLLTSLSASSAGEHVVAHKEATVAALQQ